MYIYIYCTVITHIYTDTSTTPTYRIQVAIKFYSKETFAFRKVCHVASGCLSKRPSIHCDIYIKSCIVYRKLTSLCQPAVWAVVKKAGQRVEVF